MDPSASADTEHIAAFEATARAIAGDDNVRAATSDDRVAGVQPQLVVAPGNEQRLAEILKAANDANLAVIPRGGGTKLAWGNAPRRADIVLSTARLNAIVEHAHSDLTVTVEAGCTLKQLADTLAKQNQRLALDELWPSRATVGGILSTNDNGALRLRFGSLRDLVIGVTLALPDGTLAKSGGKVVKNVAGYDLPKLVIGALGTLAVITQVTFRLHPIPKQSRTLSCLARDANEAQRIVLTIQDSKLAHSALQIRFVESMQPQIDVLFEATEAGCTAQVGQLKDILSPATVIESGPAVWKARQELYSEATANPTTAAVARFSVLPSFIARIYEALARTTERNHLRFAAIVHANGLGNVLVMGEPSNIGKSLRAWRRHLEWKPGGSLGVHDSPLISPPIDAWGTISDGIVIMLMAKQQFDPKSTLNPGRFVGGI
jgi:glycolate oxidase FAD binding subunit